MTQLIEGQPQYIKGSAAKPYELKNTGGVYSCSCPAWRNQGAPIDRRTCKHLKLLLGAAAEEARVSGGLSFSQAGTTTARIQTVQPNLSAAEIKGVDGQAIIDRAAAQGRKLRQDEKARLNGPPILLAHSYEDFPDLDPTGWWLSEKLDGVRAYWTGFEFRSRQGNVFHAPAWFKEELPEHPLDGELWMGRKCFQKTISVVKRIDGGDQWKQVTFIAFDMPHLVGKTFEERMEALDAAWRASRNPYFKTHDQRAVTSRKDLEAELHRVEGLGGEGLMIRKPGSEYEVGRSSTLLKVKPFKDAEAVVIAHVDGKGKHKGKLGGLEVRMPDGKTFNVGTGLTDEERRNPPKVGATITYRYTELTDGGIPKCASFIAVRDYE